MTCDARVRLSAATCTLLAAAALAMPAQASGTPGYARVPVGPKTGGEPSSLAAADGSLWVSYPGGTQTFRSTDLGATWKSVTTADQAGGDDCLAGDGAGGIYICNLNGSADGALLQADVWKSVDDGQSWRLATGTSDAAPAAVPKTSSNAGASSNPFGVDRDWLDAWVPPGKNGTDQADVVLYYHDFYGPSQLWVNISTDGGKTFGSPVDILANPANNPTAIQNAAAAQAYSACSTVPTAVDIVKTGVHQGRIWTSWIAADAPTSLATGCNVTQLDTFHSLWVAYSDDNGATWNPELAFDGGPGHDASTPFAAFTLDNAGNPYYAFAMNLANEYDMWMVWSKDGGTTWSGQSDLGALTSGGQPYKVNADNGTHIYPAIAAGDPGHVVVAYLATPTVVPTLPYGKFKPGGGAGASWYLWAAHGDLNPPVPVWNRTQITPTDDPMHVGDICNLGIFCVDDDLAGISPVTVFGTNRDLLDFISIDLDRTGMAHIAYTDDNTADKTNGLYGIDVANQTSGDPAFVAPAVDVPEAPAAVLLLLPAGLAVALLSRRRRRSKLLAESPVTT